VVAPLATPSTRAPTPAVRPVPAAPAPAAEGPAAIAAPESSPAAGPAAPPTSKPGARSVAPPSSEEAPPAAARSKTGPTLALLLERWAEIVEVISKSPPTRPLIVACRPVSVDGNVVTLGFPEAQSFFKDVADRRRPILEDGVSRVLGIPVSVRCVAANVEVAPLPGDPDSARLLNEFKRIYGDDAVDIGDVD
jgi:hypothetical protein